MSTTTQKTAKFRNLLLDMETYLPQAEAAFQKLAEDQSQGPRENGVAVASADPEVEEMLPDGTTPGTETPPKSNANNDAGIVPSVEGAGSSPPEEHRQYHEQSPSSKVAAASNNFTKLANLLIKTAGVAQEAKGQADPNSGTAPIKGNPKAEVGKHGKINPLPEDKTKNAELDLSPEEIADLTRKIAAAKSDALIGRTLADLVLGGFAEHSRKTAAAQVQGEAIRTAVHNKVAAMRELNYSENQIGAALEEMGRIDGYNLKIAEGEIPPGAMGGEEAMEGAMEPGGPEGGPQGGPGGDLPPELQEIVQALTQMIQSGEVTPEEAVEAAQIIDQQLGISPGGEGGGMPPGAEGGCPSCGGTGCPSCQGEEGPGPEGSPEHEAGESPEKEESEEKEKPKEEKEEKQKEDRLYQIGSGIRHKVAELRCQSVANQVFNGRMYPARKVAAMCAAGTEINAAAKWVFEEERRKIAGRDFGIEGLPHPSEATLEDVFGLLDNLVANNSITEKTASSVLEHLTVDNDNTDIVNLMHMVQGVIHGTKIADGEGMAVPPMDPTQGGGEAPPPPPNGGPPAGGPPPGVEGGDVDPRQAVEQLIGALEQLVQSGIIDEAKAVEMLNAAGLGAPPGGAGGAPGAPPEGGAPPNAPIGATPPSAPSPV